MNKKWEMVKLWDLGKVITGNTPSTSISEYYENDDIPFYKPNDILEDRVLYLSSATTYIDNRALSKVRLLPAESVLVTCIGIIGKTAITTQKSATNQQINAIVSDNSKCTANYLAYAIYSKKIYLQDIANAPVVPIINKSTFSEIEIPLPPLDEQKKIAQELDKLQSIIQMRKEQIEKMDLLVKAKFVEMFGDPVSNSMGWERKKCLETGSFKNGLNFSANENGIDIYYVGVGDFKNLFKITDISQLSKVSLNSLPSSEYLLKNDDILFVRSNGNKNLVGRCISVYPNNTQCVYSGFCIRYRKDTSELSTEYLLHFFKHSSTRKKLLGRGANIQNLNQVILGELLIPLPPIKLQNQFADYVQKVEKIKSTMHAGLEKIELLYNSRMQEYFG